MAFSRQSPLRPEVLDLNGVIEGMAELIRRTLGETIEIATELDPGLHPVRVDRSGVESAILNLCVNARDAMPGGGQLRIHTANADLGKDAPAVLRGDLQAGVYVAVAVADTGTGIAPEIQDRVFEPFFTTKPVGKGTGLGLSQVFGFLRQSDGLAALSSAPGDGTTVRLFFPCLPAAIPTAAPVAAAEPPDAHAAGAGEVCLVVEDEDMVREFTVSALEDAGYRVFAAADGAAGLRLLQSQPHVALLFTDLVLAGPLDGRTVAERALRDRPGLQVLFTTGYSDPALLAAGEAGADAHVVFKPFTAAALLSKVRSLLAAAPRPEQTARSA